MQQSPAGSLLLIVVHLFVTMAFLTGVSAQTEIGRLTLLTSRPFTSQVTSVGVRARPNHGGTEGSPVTLKQTLAVVKNVSALPSNTQGEKKHLSREHLTRGDHSLCSPEGRICQTPPPKSASAEIFENPILKMPVFFY